MALQITVVEGHDLPAGDSDGSVDPYVELRFKGTKCKTKVVKKSKHPYWGETFTFTNSYFAQVDQLVIMVYDWDRLSRNDALTSNTISIKPWFEAGTVDEWLQLTTLQGRSHGKLHLRVVVGDGTPQGSPPA
jgi:Ca2+-dependent lipid-binding protein